MKGLVSPPEKRRDLGLAKIRKCLARCVLKFQCRRTSIVFTIILLSVLENIIKGTEVSFSWLGVQIVDCRMYWGCSRWNIN